MKSGTLLSLNTARARPVSINGRKVMTAIGKQAVDGERRCCRSASKATSRPICRCMAA